MAHASTVIRTAWCAVVISKKSQRHNATLERNRNGPPREVGHCHTLRARHVLEEVVPIIHSRVQQTQRNKQDTEDNTNDEPDDTPGHGPAIQVFLRTLIRDVGPHVAEWTASGVLLGAHRFPHRLGLSLPLPRVRAGSRVAVCRLSVAVGSSSLTPALRRCADLGVVLLSLLRVAEDVVC